MRDLSTEHTSIEALMQLLIRAKHKRQLSDLDHNRQEKKSSFQEDDTQSSAPRALCSNRAKANFRYSNCIVGS